MTDFGEVPKFDQPPKSPQQEQALSYEQMDKMSSDLATLSKIRDYAHGNGYTFALTGGYAVDAIDGGEISRMHGDMDGVMFVPSEVPYETIKDAINEQLIVEITPWELVKDEEGSLEFRENDERKEWGMKRRLELDIFESSPEQNVVTRTLVDMDGKPHEFETLSVEWLLAAKVLSMTRLAAMTQEEREQEGFRDMKSSDRGDFMRLVHSHEFDEKKTRAALSEAIRYLSDTEMTEEEARVQQICDG
ncbi:hypothetical protein BH09PAT1_BH09PAT1_8590 [soil metagenome]